MIDEAKFRQTMAQFTSGVTIVTTENEGTLYGMTVASFASLSLRPPMVLICIERGVKTHDAIASAKHFAVNILASGQDELSRRFASRSDTKFEGLSLSRGCHGDPLLDGCLATMECRLADALPGGDHSIFVGEVVESEVRAGEPLVYFSSGYRELKSM